MSGPGFSVGQGELSCKTFMSKFPNTLALTFRHTMAKIEKQHFITSVISVSVFYTEILSLTDNDKWLIQADVKHK